LAEGFLVRHGGFYYLFTSFDLRCRGVKSTYRIVVGRATSITGPYYDQQGMPLLERGGATILFRQQPMARPRR
jgi:arabinan endo-1,5-alpha-L-arabinosidase